MGCFNSKSSENTMEPKQMKRCNCQDKCNHSNNKCQRCKSVMSRENFIEYYGFCENCRTSEVV